MLWLFLLTSALFASAQPVYFPAFFEPLGDGRFVFRGGGDAVVVGPQGWTAGSPELRFLNARAAAPEPLDRLPGLSSYFIGNNPARWRTGVPQYRRVLYRGVYPGVDVVYYASRGKLEYDFAVAPGSDPGAIRFWSKAGVRTNAKDDLLIGNVRQLRPTVRQDGRLIAVAYRLDKRGRAFLRLGPYDRTQPLLIDPVLEYASYFGGPALERGSGIKVDTYGNAYIVGTARAPASPNANPFQNTAGFAEKAVVFKFSIPQNAILYFAVFGGALNDSGQDLAIDAAGDAFVTGLVTSTDMPVLNAAQPQFGGGASDAFVAKLSPDGQQLLYSTYLGGNGSEQPAGIALDAAGSIYAAGSTNSTDFPTQNPLHIPIRSTLGFTTKGYLTKLSPQGNRLVYSTLFGGSGSDAIAGVAIDTNASAYIVGSSSSSDLPVASAYQSKQPASDSGFAAKVSADGQTLLYCTYLGGTLGPSEAAHVVVDAAGSAYVAGWTSARDFPVRNGAQPAYGGGQRDAFVTKLVPAGNDLMYSTYLGGSSDEFPGTPTLDTRGSVYVPGWTSSMDFPVKDSAQSYAGSYDAFVAKFTPAGDSLVYATLYGGSGADYGAAVAVDPNGNAYLTGYTSSFDLPVRNAWQPVFGGGFQDMFMAAFSAELPAGAASILAVSPQTLSFIGGVSGLAPPPQTLSVSGPPGVTFSASTAGGSWLIASPSASVTPSVITIFIDPTALGAGTYQGQISLQASDGSPPVLVPITLLVQAPPQLQDGGPLNGASYFRGAIAPGEIVVLFGTALGPPNLIGAALDSSGVLSKLLGGVRVLFDGIAAPLLYVSATQIGAVVPYELDGQQLAMVQVDNNGQLSGTITVPVVPSAPGIFTLDSSGKGASAPPASAGDVIVLFATGEGQTNPIGVDGKTTAAPLPSPVLPVSVTLGGVNAEVVYAGAAPGLVAGVMQINAVVPAGVPTGPAPIVVTVGSANSPPGPTVTIR